MSETQKIMELIRQNNEEARMREKVQELKRQKENEKMMMLNIIIGCIILMVLLCITIGLKQQGVQGCMANGYSESYCIEHS